MLVVLQKSTLMRHLTKFVYSVVEYAQVWACLDWFIWVFLLAYIFVRLFGRIYETTYDMFFELIFISLWK
jgi:hypothetical protein